MTDEEKKIHDLKFEIRQLRLRVDEDEMKINLLLEGLENANKTIINVMMTNEIALRALNNMVDDIKKLKEEQKC